MELIILQTSKQNNIAKRAHFDGFADVKINAWFEAFFIK